MARALRLLSYAMGYACVAIGLFHMLAGNAAVPGAGDAGPTLDSMGRFLGVIFAGYGLAWIWAARRHPIPPALVRALAGLLLLGGLSRLLSLAVAGAPHWFQLFLMSIELALPPVYLRLATADARAVREEQQAAGQEPRTTVEARRPAPAE